MSQVTNTISNEFNLKAKEGIQSMGRSLEKGTKENLNLTIQKNGTCKRKTHECEPK